VKLRSITSLTSWRQAMNEDHQFAGNGRGDRADGLIDYAKDQAAQARKPAKETAPAFLTRESVPGYELAELIHRGGQGVVYRAVQKSTGRIAAIKFLPLPLLPDRLDGSRFRREVRALARVENPNVVAIRDSGVVGAYGYVVMDYVPGLSLTDYAADRSLDVRGTLQLFLRICDAVHAAHLQGIIHRDLKPGNIRITPEGEPRVLDFGLARIVAENDGESQASGSVATITGQFIGSLPWASPEQARGDGRSVDLRTDIYSLGVMLFQLLTEEFPYSVTGEMRSVVNSILDTPPSRPGAYNRSVKDDLDTIVLKCLQKEPARRYQSVAELARDVRNYLEGRVIEAKRDSFLYVTRKALRRHWVASLVVLLIVVFGIGYAVTATVLVRENRLAKQEQARLAAEAKAKFRMAHRTVQIVLQELATRFERTHGTNEARRAVLKAAYSSLEPLAEEHPSDPELTVDLGRTHALLGDIALKLGDREDGRIHMSKALEIRRELTKWQPNVLAHWDDLSINLVRIGDSHRETGEYDMARGFYQEALRIDETLVQRDPTSAHLQDNLAWSYERLAHLAKRRADFADADRLLHRARLIFEQLVEREPENAIRLHGLSNVNLQLALRADWNSNEFARFVDEAIEAGERAVAAEPHNPDFRRSLSGAYQNKSAQLRDQGNVDAAWEEIEHAEALAGNLWEEDADDLRSAFPLCNAWRDKAELAEIAGNWKLAEEYCRKVLDLTAVGLSAGPSNLDLMRKRYAALRRYANHLIRCGEPESKYLPMLGEALELATQAASLPDASFEVVAEYSQLLRTVQPLALRDLAASVREAERAVEMTRESHPAMLANLAEALFSDGQLKRAREVQCLALSICGDGCSSRKRIESSVHTALDDNSPKVASP